MLIFMYAPFGSCTITNTALDGLIHFFHVPTAITLKTLVLIEKRRDISTLGAIAISRLGRRQQY